MHLIIISIIVVVVVDTCILAPLEQARIVMAFIRSNIVKAVHKVLFLKSTNSFTVKTQILISRVRQLSPSPALSITFLHRPGVSLCKYQLLNRQPEKQGLEKRN